MKTTDSAALAAAEDCYRGEYAGIDDYIRHVLGWDLPPHLQRILSCTRPEMLRGGYENGKIIVWEIQMSDKRALIFESPRAAGEARP